MLNYAIHWIGHRNRPPGDCHDGAVASLQASRTILMHALPMPMIL
ncbi:MAG: hypothetical protein PVH37_05450 [Desulfobacterales bacterium]|jgi:hypothetical protein